jgi:hypothetical protein
VLDSHGIDHERYVHDLDQHLPAHEAIGADMGRRFAELALARAQPAGVSPSSAA